MKKELYEFSEYKSFSFTEPMALYLILDTSGSMTTVVGDKTRFQIMIEQVKTFIYNLVRFSSAKSIPIDIGFATMQYQQTYELRAFNASVIDVLMSWIDSLEPDDTTPYDIPMAAANEFFDVTGTPAENAVRKLMFLTDGVPNPSNSAVTAYNQNQDMIDGLGIYETNPVEIYGIGIDLSNSSDLDLLDNMSGTYVINSAIPNALYNYIFDLVIQPEERLFFTSSDESEVYDGETYFAIPIGRSSIELKAEVEKLSLQIEFSINNTFARKWLTDPTRGFLTVKVLEKDTNESTASTIWVGRLSNVSVSGSKISLIFNSSYTSLVRLGITRRYSRTCPYTLYGRGCNVYQEDIAFKQAATITNVNDLVYTISTSQPTHYYTQGLLRYNNEILFIRSQVGNIFTVAKFSQAIREQFDSAGSVSVFIYPGCDKTLATCISKFNNVENFGGQPFMPGKNPFDGTAFI